MILAEPGEVSDFAGLLVAVVADLDDVDARIARR
jgi:hypothetical protein